MSDWQSAYLGRGILSRNLSGFEIEAFFTYSDSERRVIEDERRTPALKLALALQIGFLRMTGRLLEALRMVRPVLWRHLGAQFEIDAPDLASLRTMYRRRRTLFEQQHLACAVRSIYVGRVSAYQAKQHEEMQAVADASSLLANLVMAWNTMKMQSVLDHWNARRSTAVPPALIERIAPTRTEGINLRGVFTFPIEQYRDRISPSLSAVKSRALAG